jgi:hypothetical protein
LRAVQSFVPRPTLHDIVGCTVVSVSTAHPRCFCHGYRKAPPEKKQYRYSNHSFRAGWWQDTNTKPVWKSTSRLSRVTVGILYQPDGIKGKTRLPVTQQSAGTQRTSTSEATSLPKGSQHIASSKRRYDTGWYCLHGICCGRFCLYCHACLSWHGDGAP